MKAQKKWKASVLTARRLSNASVLTARRSQVTIFIIVGLVVLIGGVVFFYSTQKLPKEIEPEIKIIEEQAPLEFDPIKKYADDCAYSVGIEGLKLVGKQGGYISFEDNSLNTEPFSITQSPTESDAVQFAADSELKVPYWWHLKSANDCKGDCSFASKRPELRQTGNSIEKQLERYITQRFKECLNNFEPFVEQGFKISEVGSEAGKVKSDVVIGTEDVSILVEYPLDIEKQELRARLSQFLVRVPVNLDKVYDLATKITNLEIKHRYLEKHALNLLAAFSGVDEQRLPPMSEMQFKFGSTTSWRKSELRNKITELLAPYIQLFQIDGTYNYERNLFDSDIKQRLYDSTIIPVANSSFRELEPYFSYLDFWPIYFDLNCKGENCIPSSANSLLSFLGVQDYRFAYDLSFPVLVEVKDPFALNGQGYSFNFFLEGNIRNNRAMPADFAPLERIAISESSLLCDSKTSGNVTVSIKSSSTKKPVEEAQVLYSVTGESCFIGATNADGILKSPFPVGVGGVVSIVKEGYIGKSIEFDAKIGKEESLKAKISPLYTKKLSVKKKNVVKIQGIQGGADSGSQSGWQFVDAPIELSNKESAAITLTRIDDGTENNDGAKNDGTELEFSSVANYAPKQEESSEIEIAPGKYSADISLMLNERIIIPEKEKCKSLIVTKQCFTIPKVDFGERATEGMERFPEGGLKLNFTLSPSELESSNEIVFYVISIDIAGIPEKDRVIEDIEQMNKIEEYSSIYQLALQPALN